MGDFRAMTSNVTNITQIPIWDDENATTAVSSLFTYYVYGVLVPVVQGFGLVGNLASLIVFCHKRLRHGLDEIEQSATVGLVALALSDFCFCLSGFPVVFLNNTVVRGNRHLIAMSFYYRTYGDSFLNLFVFTSTWITVLLSMERYAVVCRPYAAQKFIRVRRTVVMCVVVYCISIAFNIPHLFRYRVEKAPCMEDSGKETMCYFRRMTSIFPHSGAEEAYTIAWNVWGTLIPLLLLIVSNARLILAIRKSQVRGIVDPERYCTSRITRVLVTIVCLFLILVCPSMVLAVLDDHFVRTLYRKYTKALVVTNFTQALWFSINFILYFAMCKQFRQVVIRRICCRSSQVKSSSNKAKKTSNKVRTPPHHGQYQRYQLAHIQHCGKYPIRFEWALRAKEVCWHRTMWP